MGRNYRTTPVSVATSVTATTAAPSAATDGLAYPDVGVTESFVMVTANGSGASDTISVTPYWYDPTNTGWCEGNAASITGSGVVACYCIGTRIYLRVTAISLSSGSFNISTQFLSKGS